MTATPPEEVPPPAGPAPGPKPVVPSGAVERARKLARGIADRLAAVGEDSEDDADDRRRLSSEEDEGGLVLSLGGRTVARLAFRPGFVRAEVDPRAGVGDAVALRRLGSPHRDAARSAAGWRVFDVRTHRDASALVSALRGHGRGAAVEPTVGGIPIARVDVGRVRVARIQDMKLPGDGFRVLVDRPWPRDLSKDEAARLFEEWWPEIAPSDKLRRAYGVVPGRLRAFRRAYLAELRGTARAELVSKLRARVRKGAVTLLTATRDVSLSHAPVLASAIARGKTPNA